MERDVDGEVLMNLTPIGSSLRLVCGGSRAGRVLLMTTQEGEQVFAQASRGFLKVMVLPETTQGASAEVLKVQEELRDALDVPLVLYAVVIKTPVTLPGGEREYMRNVLAVCLTVPRAEEVKAQGLIDLQLMDPHPTGMHIDIEDVVYDDAEGGEATEGHTDA